MIILANPLTNHTFDVGFVVSDGLLLNRYRVITTRTTETAPAAKYTI